MLGLEMSPASLEQRMLYLPNQDHSSSENGGERASPKHPVTQRITHQKKLPRQRQRNSSVVKIVDTLRFLLQNALPPDDGPVRHHQHQDHLEVSHMHVEKHDCFRGDVRLQAPRGERAVPRVVHVNFIRQLPLRPE